MTDDEQLCKVCGQPSLEVVCSAECQEQQDKKECPHLAFEEDFLSDEEPKCEKCKMPFSQISNKNLQ